MRALARSPSAWLLASFVLVQFLPAGTPGQAVIVVAVVVAGLGYAAYRQPVVAVGGVVVGAAYLGGLAVLAAPPLVVLLGHRATRSFRRGPPVPGQRRRLAVVALLAALATLPFAGLGYERVSGAGSGRRRPAEAAAPGVGGNRLLEAIARLLRRVAPPEEPDPRRWLLLALLLLVALLVAALVAWLVWRRRRRSAGPETMSAVARLERVGRRVGRRRRADEGLLSYASTLAARTGDRRLGLAGPEVSALVYRSGAASGERVEQALGALEASPPPKPARRRWSDRWRSLRAGVAARVTMPRAVFGLAGAMLVVGGVAVVVPRLTSLEAGAGRQAWSLWDEPGSVVEQWWSCETFDEWPVARAGVDHRTLDRAATEARGLADPGDGGLERMTTWDGESFVTYEGDEYPTSDDEARPRLPFPDAAAVLRRFGVDDAAVVSTGRDATGATFSRYESLPHDQPELFSGRVTQLGGRWEISLVWVLDVWLDDAGRPVRVRQMVNGDPGRFEWLRLDQPTGSSKPPPCTTGDTAGAGPWLGREAWTPTLAVPLQVAYDAAGHPYDPVEVAPGAAWRPLGSGLASPTGIVAVTSLDALSADADGGDAAPAVAVPPGTTLRVEQFEVRDGAPAHRIALGAGGGDVARWRLADELDLDGLMSVLAVVEPGFDPDRIEEVYDRIDSPDRSGRTVDLDDDGVDDLLVLALYGGSIRVYVGEDPAGRAVELAAVSHWLPWRLLGLPGEPPADVLRREAELADCAAGARPLAPDGTCPEG